MMKKLLFVLLISLFYYSTVLALQNIGDEKVTNSQSETYNYKVGDNGLFFMPTAYTMPKGASYFCDYELFFLNYSYAPTDRIHLGVITLLPMIQKKFYDFLTFGIKHNYLRTEKLASAYWFTLTPFGKYITAGNVVSYRANKILDLHLGLGLYQDMEKDFSQITKNYSIMAGMKLKNFIAEYEYNNSEINGMKIDNGIIILGFRLGRKKMAFDLGIMREFRQLTKDDIFYFLPFLKLTYKIK